MLHVASMESHLKRFHTIGIKSIQVEHEKRILFCIPRDDFDIIGTTDTDSKTEPSQVVASVEDVKYILKVLKDYFPDVSVEESDIISSYAGIRPLVKDGSSSESAVSRNHWIKNVGKKIG